MSLACDFFPLYEDTLCDAGPFCPISLAVAQSEITVASESEALGPGELTGLA